MDIHDIVDRQAVVASLDHNKLSDLLDRLRHAEEGSTDIDVGVCIALGGRKSGHLWQNPLEMAWTGAPYAVSTSLDRGSDLVERFYPSDAGDMRNSLLIRTGLRPGARIFYDARDEQAEGGWALGARNQLEVRAATAPLAVLVALVGALMDEMLRRNPA